MQSYHDHLENSSATTVVAVVIPNSPLHVIVEINEQHRLAKLHAAETIKHAVRCGELLLQQKKLLPHGEFTRWVEQNCEFSARSARAYMQVTENFQNGSALPFSSLRQALQKQVPDDDGELPSTAAVTADSAKKAVVDVPAESPEPKSQVSVAPKATNANIKKTAVLRGDGKPALVEMISSISTSLSVFYSLKTEHNLNFDNISPPEAAELVRNLEISIQSMARLHKALTKRTRVP